MIGQVVSHYRILEKLGQGGMGEVFLAEDASLHRKVALKFLPPEMERDDTARKRFIREARSAAALDHPYICHINEVGECEGRSFIVMEYVDGRSLKDRLAQGPLPLKDGLQIAIEVTEALEAAHRKGIIHRDIKPANIMLTQTDHAKVMDFGLAKQLIPPRGAEGEAETITVLTAEGGAVGTPVLVREFEFRWDESEEHFRRAIALDPGDATAHHWYALMLARRGRPAEALAAIRKALELDPLSTMNNQDL
ncbi:MAG: tetratricopeptide repeat protein, partial [Acidobacteria bacterium]|nr:tetratricopeptide repeat protein [Acidobacteriota bacterium]